MAIQLSTRGILASNTVLRKDFELFFEATQNLYNETTNPKGVFTLNVAENVLSWFSLQKKISKITSRNIPPDWVAGYTSCLGHPDFRSSLAKFMSFHLCKTKIKPDNLAVSAGATAVIEMTSWLLCEAGEVAVFPAPCYPVYTMDIGNKSRVERYDLQTHKHISELTQGPPLSLLHLDKALEDISTKGKKMRLLVLTSPDNPTGGIYYIKKLRSIADWCIHHSIHLVVNEIYGLSIIPSKSGKKPDFVSFANVMKEKKSDFLHLWYSLSKDLGVSGFRVGVLHTLNESLIKAYDNFNAPHLVSNHTQWIFQMILSDKDFIKKYIRQNQKRLGKSYYEVIKILNEMQIPYAPAAGSLFVWMDMSEFLKDQSSESDDALWRDIYQKSGVLLTPGDGFGHLQKGMFRLVYSCVPRKHLVKAMQRLKRYIIQRRKKMV